MFSLDMLICAMRPLTYTTPLLPGFSRLIRRKKPLSAQQKLAKELAILQEKSFKQVGVTDQAHKGNQGG